MDIILIFILFTGLGLPVVKKLSESGNWQKRIGESFFIGIIVVVCLMNLMQILNIDFSISMLFYIILVISVLFWIVFFYKSAGNIKQLDFSASFLMNNKITATITLVIILHFIFIVIQNSSLPLTSWDSWTGWVAKAKIWYFYGLNETLLSESEWLSNKQGMTSLITHYPDGLSLLYLFNSGGLGWDETRLNAVYPALYIAFLLAFYGNIKSLSDSSLVASFAALIFATIPLVGTHIVLAGYADIWVSAFLFLALVHLQFYSQSAFKKDIYLFIFFALGMISFKQEGLIWLLFMFPVFFLLRLSSSRVLIIMTLISLTLLLWYFTGGFSIGNFVFRPDRIAIPGIGDFHFSFLNTTGEWLESLFLSRNWNILWYSLPVTLALFARIRHKPVLLFSATYLIFSLLFLLVLFYFSYANKFASNFTSLNRLILHIVPVYIYFMVLTFYQYFKQSRSVDESP